jgi:hypothetical protein
MDLGLLQEKFISDAATTLVEHRTLQAVNMDLATFCQALISVASLRQMCITRSLPRGKMTWRSSSGTWPMTEAL